MSLHLPTVQLPPPSCSDNEFYKVSASVIFSVNKTDIRKDDPFLSLYRNEILPLLNDEHLQLRKVFVRGAASPEGSYANNSYLGRARTQALISEIRSGLKDQYAAVDFEYSAIIEDYAYLCILMEENADEDAAYVKSICQNAGWNEHAIKNKLKTVRSGSLWQRLLKEYFPQLRAARIILWFSECDKEHAMQFLAGRPELPSIQASPIQTPERLAAPCNGLAFAYAPALEHQQDNIMPRRHLIALRTNLVHDFFYMPNFGFAPSPNLQLEYYPLNGHWTYNLGVTWGTWRKWDQQKFWQVRDFQFEARRYFKGGGQFTGLYLGGYLHGDVYGIGLSGQKGWQGEGGGVGISLGYVLPLTKKGDLRMEFMLGVGAFVSVFDPYVYGNPLTSDKDGFYYYDYLGSASEFKRRNHLFTWFGPTNLGIQLTYDIIYRKRKQVK